MNGQEALEGEAIADQMLGLLQAQPVLRHQTEHLELQHRVERRSPAFRAVIRPNRRVENRSEQLESTISRSFSKGSPCAESSRRRLSTLQNPGCLGNGSLHALVPEN